MSKYRIRVLSPRQGLSIAHQETSAQSRTIGTLNANSVQPLRAAVICCTICSTGHPNKYAPYDNSPQRWAKRNPIATHSASKPQYSRRTQQTRNAVDRPYSVDGLMHDCGASPSSAARC